MIKVVLIGNMNNNFFSFMRYLRDLGYDAHLFLSNYELSQFKPENDTYELEKWKPYIKELDFGNDTKMLLTSKKKIRKMFFQFDVIISSGWFPAYLYKGGITSDIICPFGSDLYLYPVFNLLIKDRLFGSKKLKVKSILKLPFTFYASRMQKKAYQIARNINIQSSNGVYSRALKDLNLNYNDLSQPMVYTNEINSKNIYCDDIIRELDDRFIVFCQSRHYWKSLAQSERKYNYTGKGNEKLIKGFHKFIKNNRIENAILLLFEYGPDVNHSKDLINRLKIERYVIWCRKMPRKELMQILKCADIAADQFNDGYFGGTGREILSQGIPLMNYIRYNKEEYENMHHQPFPPILNVRTVNEIADVIEDCYNNRKKYSAIGKQSKEWFDKYEGIGLSKKYALLIEKIFKEKNQL